MLNPALTPKLLQICTGASQQRAMLFLAGFEEAMDLYQINTPARMGMFLANCGHESGNLQWRQEIWGPTDQQKRYEGRLDLGNTEPGDGRRFCGRGWWQTTGRGNYRKLTQRLRKRWPQMQVPDFELNPEMLAQSEWCALSAADYCEMRSMNLLADQGKFDNYCDVINKGHVTQAFGDTNGFIHRQALWKAALPALQAAATH